jgi:serine/threonine protein kinase
MELLGKSLDRLFSDCKKNFSYKTIFQIGYQLIQRIEYVHSKGYIHRDIKPGNFVIGKNENHKKIYIIDFGLSKRYIDKNTDKHIPYKEGKGLTGTARYVSLFTHYGIEQSRRDDIEGIAFNLIYFAKGKLPWQGVKTKNKKEKHKKIMESKIYYKPEKLCEGLSGQFASLLEYARDLEFEERPDYKHIKLMFKNSIKELGEDVDWIFDWDLLTEDKEKKIEENSEEKDEKDNDNKNNKKSLNNNSKNKNYKNEKNEE